MNNYQKMGGLSALISATTFIVGIVLAFTALAPYMTGELDPVQTAAFLVDNQTIMYIWNQIIFVVFGIFLVVLVLALYDRLKADSSAMIQTATAFGLIWAGLMFASGMVFNVGLLGTVVDLYGVDPAQSATVGLAIRSVEEGLGGGNEIVGGLWILLVSWGALRAGGLPKALNYVGVLVGLAGLITIVPALGMLGIIFGLGSIVWFIWLGIVMLRSNSSNEV